MVWELADWLDERSGQRHLWFIKRLAGNDTGITGGHQAGPYIPKPVLFEVFPELRRPSDNNPEVRFDCTIDSHDAEGVIRAVWYNQGTRNETRLTGWARGFAGTASPLLDHESTGALTVFCFDLSSSPRVGHVWVCANEKEEDLVEERVGQVDPGRGKTWPDMLALESSAGSCWLEYDRIPKEWLQFFPSGVEIIRKTLELRRGHGQPPDLRLLHRRDCEYQIFRSLEVAVEFPRAAEGYASMQEFLDHAQSVLQRRKSRSGNSLQLHVRELLREEALREGIDFSYNPVSEGNKRPDFLFPNADAYHDSAYPDAGLRMLAVKSSVKDRWRQILNEAHRIQTKHLLTVQEGVSANQFLEMQNANVQLVVPKSLHRKYPHKVQASLMTLEGFLAEVRLLSS